jgi:hypothetical protein
MSIAGILSSTLFNSSSQAVTSPQQQFQKEFQQLGQALQSGNLSAAQSDFATLQQNLTSTNATSSPSAANSLTQAFSQLGKDLQSGNLSAAQQAFSTVRQDAQTQGTQSHHHHHHGGGAGSGEQSNIPQEFAQLGQDLQSGNVSAAQKAYSAVQQSFAAFGANSASATAATLSSIA